MKEANLKQMSNTPDTMEQNKLTQILDKGIDDMESGREIPLDDAFELVAELIEKRKLARV